MPRLARIASDLLAALSAAHRAGLVHRDVKPDNIVLLTGANTPWSCKLVDFGVVKVAGEALTRAGQVIGTPAYMSPEQWQGTPVDPRSDFYALGGCLYHALMGRTAITSVTEAVQPGFAAQRARAMPLENPAIPVALAEVVARALHPSPAQRFQSAEEMSAALGRALSQTVVTSPPPARAPTPSYGPPIVAGGVTGPPFVAGGVTGPPAAGYASVPAPPYAPSYGPPQNAYPPAGGMQAPVPWWKGQMARNLLLAAVLVAVVGWYAPSSCLPF